MASAEAKAKGNAAFSAGRFEEAVGHFSDAIKVDEGNHVLYSNRSAAHASLKHFGAALDDAKKVVELKPDWAKGYSRLGAAYCGLESYDESIKAYQDGLAIEPANETLQAGLQEVEAVKARGGAGGGNPMGALGGIFSSPDVWAKLSMNPQTRGYLQQPDFVAMLQAVQANPSSLGQYMQDPRMMQVMGVLMGINIQTGDQFNDSMNAQKPAAPKPKQPEPEPEPEPEPMLTEDEKAEKEAKAKAQAEKELGNAAYKKKSFEEAIAHYNAAQELDSSDISFMTNRAAVYLEMGKFQECIADCDAAVEKGRELRADYKMVARAMARKGTALEKSGDMEGAIAMYNKALTEHRSADVLNKLRACEALLKKKTEEAYFDVDKANEEKEKGNEHFKASRFPEAVAAYTEALRRNPNDHKLYSNRAACYMKLGAFMEAKSDADKCISMDPKFPKGYTRKGAVQFYMKEYDKAIKTYEEGLKHDPENSELQDGIKRCVEMINKGNRGELSEEEMKARQERAMADPEIQEILGDPVMRQVLSDMQADPKAAQDHMKNPMVMGKIQKLVNAGILQIR